MAAIKADTKPDTKLSLKEMAKRRKKDYEAHEETAVSTVKG